MKKVALAVSVVMLMMTGSAILADNTPKGRIVIQMMLTPDTDHNDYHVHCGGALNYAEKEFFIDQVDLEGPVITRSASMSMKLDIHNGAATIELLPLKSSTFYRFGTHDSNGTMNSLLYFYVSPRETIVTISETNRREGKTLLVETDLSRRSVRTFPLTDKQFDEYFSPENVAKRNEAQVRRIAGQQ